MSAIIEKRNEKLMSELKDFVATVLRRKSNLKRNSVITFTLTLTNKRKLKCQCLDTSSELDVKHCSSVQSLRNRLSDLQCNDELRFYRDDENNNRFHIEIKNEAAVNKQMQIAF